ncbi:B12-binding domain-containing radical SAM protein [Chloroflexota bacterium]
MRILLVMHEGNSPYNVFPYGIGYLAAALRNAGHAVTIFDQATGHYADKELYSFIKSEKPFDFIGVGFQAAYFHAAQNTCKAIKDACGDTPLVLGGSAPSASPAYFLKKFNADYVLIGEADLSVLDLVSALQGNIKLQDVGGLCWQQDGTIMSTPRKDPPKDLDALPFPAWDLFDMKSYTFPHRHQGVTNLVKPLGMLTSRGCPYTCKFCYRIEKGFRVRSIENCLEEIRLLINKYGVNFIAFHDDLFIVSKKRTLAFCEAIEKSGLRFNWLCNGRFNIADREQLKAMKRTGCVLISYGLESGDQKILDEMDKKITVEQILEVSAITKEEGILVSVPSMFGLPGETAESLEKTVEAVIAATSWHDKRTIRPMQPYPGSPYWYQCLKQGLIKDEEDFYSRYFSSEKYTVNMSDVSDSEFDKVMYQANVKLLRAHYEHALETDIQMFQNVYFENDATTFVPMR